jgi:hypothetical protein
LRRGLYDERPTFDSYLRQGGFNQQAAAAAAAGYHFPSPFAIRIPFLNQGYGVSALEFS